ncbi:MAG: RidA family protein [Actinobacteria bacterium]|nr:RidA family protein [Actinomycetota bacterium]
MIEERLAELGLELPPAPAPVASYIPVTIVGELAFVAGQVPLDEGKLLLGGKLGGEVNIEEANAAARRCALQALSALRDALGTLDRVAGIAQVTVYVASAPGFTDQSKVANGASDALVEVFEESGRHARVAVGVSELPLGAAVEVAVIARLAGTRT